MSIRAVEIPAAQEISGAYTQLHIEISLRDAYGRVSAAVSDTDDDLVGGLARVIAGEEDKTINLTTTDSIIETVRYWIKVQGINLYQIYRNRALADGVGTLAWEDFVGAAESPINGSAFTTPPSDGEYYAYKDGAWVNITNKIINP